MPYREKVIKGLECCIWKEQQGKCEECPYYLTLCIKKDAYQLKEDALALLKAQEPVEPVVDIDTWKCGKCGHTLEHQELLGDNILFHEQYNYCPECGQAVKWE
jgi:ribosomal protein S27AE